MFGKFTGVRNTKQILFLAKLCSFFWWTSDYGSSTKRIVGVFFAFLFAVIYVIPTEAPGWAFWPTPLDTPYLEGLDKYSCNTNPDLISSGQDDLIDVGNCTTKSVVLFGRSLYFSVVTMTTLGFGDISAHPASLMGHIMVAVQVFIGYVLLGALITRLSILFQNVD
ncbi:MAG: ion channel [Synechococcus sp.]